MISDGVRAASPPIMRLNAVVQKTEQPSKIVTTTTRLAPYATTEVRGSSFRAAAPAVPAVLQELSPTPSQHFPEVVRAAPIVIRDPVETLSEPIPEHVRAAPILIRDPLEASTRTIPEVARAAPVVMRDPLEYEMRVPKSAPYANGDIIMPTVTSNVAYPRIVSGGSERTLGSEDIAEAFVDCAAPPFTAEQLQVVDRRTGAMFEGFTKAVLENCRTMILEVAPDSFRDYFENLDEQVKLLFDQVSFLSTSCEQRFQNIETAVETGFTSSDKKHQGNATAVETRFQEMVNNLNVLSQSFEERLQGIEIGSGRPQGSPARVSEIEKALSGRQISESSRIDALEAQVLSFGQAPKFGTEMHPDVICRFEVLERRMQTAEESFDERHQDMIQNLNLLSTSFEERLQSMERPLDRLSRSIEERPQNREQPLELELLTRSIEERLEAMERRETIARNDVSGYQDMEMELRTRSIEERIQSGEKSLELMSISIEERLQGIEQRELVAKNDLTPVSIWSSIEQRLTDMSVEMESTIKQRFTDMSAGFEKDLSASTQKLRELALNLESEVQERCRSDTQIHSKNANEFADIRKWIVQELGVLLTAMKTSEASKRESAKAVSPTSQPELDASLVREMKLEIKKELDSLVSERNSLKNTLQSEREGRFTTILETISTEQTTREQELKKVYSLQSSCKDDVAGCKQQLESLRKEIRSALDDIKHLKDLERHLGKSSSSSSIRARDISPSESSRTVLGSVLWGR